MNWDPTIPIEDSITQYDTRAAKLFILYLLRAETKNIFIVYLLQTETISRFAAEITTNIELQYVFIIGLCLNSVHLSVRVIDPTKPLLENYNTSAISYWQVEHEETIVKCKCGGIMPWWGNLLRFSSTVFPHCLKSRQSNGIPVLETINRNIFGSICLYIVPNTGHIIQACSGLVCPAVENVTFSTLIESLVTNRNRTRFWNIYTVEILYSTIYYSKYFIELNFDKSTEYVALWTHKRHPIPRPFGRAMECLLWVLQQKLTVL